MKKFAFTMAEILISLTIVGVIAAVTLPALQGNINEKTWATQKKALYSRMTQAIAMMPAVNGYGFDPDNANSVKTKATLAFINDFGKVLKVNNICDYDHIQDCGIRVENNKLKYANALGIQQSLDVTDLGNYMESNHTKPEDPDLYDNPLDIKNAALETVNGESMLVIYNPFCGSDAHDTSGNVNHMYNKVCATFIYDLNGLNGPNTFGKDVGVVSVLYSTDSIVVAPLPSTVSVSGNKNQADAISACRLKDEETRIPNLEEAITMGYNYMLYGNRKESGSSETDIFWTNSTIDTENAWTYCYDGWYAAEPKTSTKGVLCIKR